MRRRARSRPLGGSRDLHLDGMSVAAKHMRTNLKAATQAAFRGNCPESVRQQIQAAEEYGELHAHYSSVKKPSQVMDDFMKDASDAYVDAMGRAHSRCKCNR